MQLWLEGYRARGEACKQAAIVSSILITAIGMTVKDTNFLCTRKTLPAIIFLVLGVATSALAYLFMGWAVTNAASKLKSLEVDTQNAEENLEIVTIENVHELENTRILLATIFGVLQIICLIIGLYFTVFAFTKIGCDSLWSWRY